MIFGYLFITCLVAGAGLIIAVSGRFENYSTDKAGRILCRRGLILFVLSPIWPVLAAGWIVWLVYELLTYAFPRMSEE